MSEAPYLLDSQSEHANGSFPIIWHPIIPRLGPAVQGMPQCQEHVHLGFEEPAMDKWIRSEKYLKKKRTMCRWSRGSAEMPEGALQEHQRLWVGRSSRRGIALWRQICSRSSGESCVTTPFSLSLPLFLCFCLFSDVLLLAELALAAIFMTFIGRLALTSERASCSWHSFDDDGVDEPDVGCSRQGGSTVGLSGALWPPEENRRVLSGWFFPPPSK